jgi:hypothetical protein
VGKFDTFPTIPCISLNESDYREARTTLSRYKDNTELNIPRTTLDYKSAGLSTTDETRHTSADVKTMLR